MGKGMDLVGWLCKETGVLKVVGAKRWGRERIFDGVVFNVGVWKYGG